jgi:toxin YoeB
MKKYNLKFMPKAESDMDYHLRVGSKSRLTKIARILEELELNPSTGVGRVERLKHDFSGKWSRRIDDVHRIVYKIDDDNDVVVVYQMKDHYR